MFLVSVLINILQILILISAICALISYIFFRNPKYFFMSFVSLVFFVVNWGYLEGYRERLTEEEIQKEERILNNNLLNLPEGCYVLDGIITTDSAKTRFTIEIPGLAKNRMELLAYETSEWRAEDASPGDTLIFIDHWSNKGTHAKYDRVVQKLGPDHIGLGYISHQWLERPNWRSQ